MTQRVRWSFASDHDATGEVIATALSTSNRFYALIKLDAGGFATEEFANLCSAENDELPTDVGTVDETSQEIAARADAAEAAMRAPLEAATEQLKQPKKKRSLLERSDTKQGDSK